MGSRLSRIHKWQFEALSDITNQAQRLLSAGAHGYTPCGNGKIMKGQILDVYAEGEPTFRACVLELMDGGNEIVRVINLDTGETSMRGCCECEKAVIENIFNIDGV